METIDFTACKHLDFGDNYSATKNLVSAGGVTKIVWQRQNGQLCQFCALRGRINYITGCLTKEWARCNEYEEVQHSVPLESVDIT